MPFMYMLAIEYVIHGSVKGLHSDQAIIKAVGVFDVPASSKL